jgi:hypothetical protein
MEGDVLLVETVARLADTIEFSEQSSIVFRGELHHVPDERLRDPSLQRDLGDDTLFPAEIQAAFHQYYESISDPMLYHRKTLTIPLKLKKLINFDANFISQVVKFALLPKSLKLKETDFVEHRVTLRRYHFAHLDATDIRVPRTFGDICGDRPLRYVKLSYLLSLGFDGLVSSGLVDRELADAVDFAFTDSESLPDDDEAWLDSTARPPHSLEAVGAEMAERVASFVSEVSGFDSIDASGSINFDGELFEHRLAHFFDSSSSCEEEEEEEEVRELLTHLDMSDHSLLRTTDPLPGVRAELEHSINAQPNGCGPMSDLATLFELGD